MPDYLLIESRDPFESRSFAQRCDLALTLRADGAHVTILMVENGVLGLRRAAKLRELEPLSKAGVRLLVDDFALRERGIASAELAPAVEGVSLDACISELTRGARALWT
jgi:intracellular sulfur oxidation DsrE/DsrF family protein